MSRDNPKARSADTRSFIDSSIVKDITLVEDCCATTYGPQAHNEAEALVKKHYGQVVSSNQIIETWAKKPE